ncbi:ABC transporter ATP-binding protein [Saccharomonospora saliphila]|uniref:ABC transporter ATP-binding protein n=1 Tax=Saccharomonospora saliphila TaxID=369829 RepID=UPI0003A501C2|nr:ATP-binding cassette domain-containing protein [Saccharomonospora saliphila]
MTFRYGRRTALSGVTWEVPRGVTGLLGPNGAGKTTLLNLLVGLTKPSSGEIVFSGGGRESAVGFVPQQYSTAGEMRVLDTVAYAAWINGVARKECIAAAERALAEVELGNRAGDRVRSLSGGQRQRLGIAAALAHRPQLVVLDEPTSGLDPGQRLRAREVISAIGARYTVVLSTHLIEDIAHVCERVAVLAQGRMAFDGTVDELTALVEDTEGAGSLGSAFERAYESLINTLGGARD